MRNKLVMASSFLVSFWFYVRHVAPSVTAGDSGEFMATAATLSLAHAPSYPLYTLVSRMFIDLIPWGALSFRVNMFSAFCAASTIVLLTQVFRGFGIKTLWAFSFSIFYGLTYSFWVNSLVTEVFPLHILISVFLIYVLIQISNIESPQSNLAWPLLFVFVLGLGLANHQTLIFFIPPLIYVVWMKKIMPICLTNLHWFIFFGVLGFTVNLMLPIRSAKSPPLNWGQPTTPYKLYRTLARKDYGSLSLALGESPTRSIANTTKQLIRFFKQMKKEMQWPLLIILLVGFVLAVMRQPVALGGIGLLFLLSGPGFYLLGNLPFNSQSEGIMGRFFMLPTLALTFGWIGFLRLPKKVTASLVMVSILLVGWNGYGEAAAHRNHYLVRDYGTTMLKTLPPDSALFMDGGDDAFYSLAMLQYAENKRPDLMIHDRGGLIFKNPYGADFRKISKDEKRNRRWFIEKGVLQKKRLYYSSMDPNVLPGSTYDQAGYLIEANPKEEINISWPLIALRGLYPLQTSDYRTRALGAYFPFMQGKDFLEKNQLQPALAFFRRAQIMGYDVDWLRKNLNHFYENESYKKLNEKDYQSAELLYKSWIQFDNSHPQALNNLGVVYESKGEWENAHRVYEKSMNRFPSDPQAAYNLSVYYWKRNQWEKVVHYLDEVLKRKPDHQDAKKFRTIALGKLNQSHVN